MMHRVLCAKNAEKCANMYAYMHKAKEPLDIRLRVRECKSTARSSADTVLDKYTGLRTCP